MTSAVASGVQAALSRRAAMRLQRQISQHQQAERRESGYQPTLADHQRSLRNLSRLGIQVIDMRGKEPERPN